MSNETKEQDPKTIQQLLLEIEKEAGTDLPSLFRQEERITEFHRRALELPFSVEAIKRSNGSNTGRGYNTTGYGYQYIADRLNRVLGIGCWRALHSMESSLGKTQSGKDRFIEVCSMTIEAGFWEVRGMNDGPVNFFRVIAQGDLYGGHISLDEADAKKGAFTNAFKKTAAFALGVGGDAFRGEIDDDDAPSSEARDGSTDPRYGQAKKIRAKFDGTCLICGETIEKGSFMAYRKGTDGEKARAAHWECFTDAMDKQREAEESQGQEPPEDPDGDLGHN